MTSCQSFRNTYITVPRDFLFFDVTGDPIKLTIYPRQVYRLQSSDVSSEGTHLNDRHLPLPLTYTSVSC